MSRSIFLIFLFLILPQALSADTESVKIQTQALKMTGWGGTALPKVETSALKMTGWGGAALPKVQTSVLKMTGMKSELIARPLAAKKITTTPLEMIGTRARRTQAAVSSRLPAQISKSPDREKEIRERTPPSRSARPAARARARASGEEEVDSSDIR